MSDDDVYIIREHDGTSMSAPPRVLGVALGKEAADRLVAEWDPQQHWSSLSAQKATVLAGRVDGQLPGRPSDGGEAMGTEWGFTNPDRKDFVVWGPVTEEEAREFVAAHPNSGSEVVRRQIGDWKVDIHE